MLPARAVRRFLDAVAGRPWLRVLETSVYHVPERLYEMDRDLFVVWNRRTQQFEVHDAAVPVAAFTRVLEANELDVRVIRRVMDAAHEREPFREAEAWASSERARRKRALDATIRGVAESFVDAAYLDVWGRRVFPTGR